jgi:hypothetical protein
MTHTQQSLCVIAQDLLESMEYHGNWQSTGVHDAHFELVRHWLVRQSTSAAVKRKLAAVVYSSSSSSSSSSRRAPQPNDIGKKVRRKLLTVRGSALMLVAGAQEYLDLVALSDKHWSA